MRETSWGFKPPSDTTYDQRLLSEEGSRCAAADCLSMARAAVLGANGNAWPSPVPR